MLPGRKVIVFCPGIVDEKYEWPGLFKSDGQLFEGVDCPGRLHRQRSAIDVAPVDKDGVDSGTGTTADIIMGIAGEYRA